MRGVEAAEQQLAEVDLETAFLDFDEADSFASDRLADEVVPGAEAHVAVRFRREDLVLAGVLGLFDARERPS